MPRIWQHNHALAERFYRGLQEIAGVEIVSPQEEAYRTAMISFRMKDRTYAADQGARREGEDPRAAGDGRRGQLRARVVPRLQPRRRGRPHPRGPARAPVIPSAHARRHPGRCRRSRDPAGRRRRPVPDAQRPVPRPSLHVARRLGCARLVPARARARVGRPAAAAGKVPVEAGRLRRTETTGLHRVEGLLRKPPGLLRHGQPVPADRRRSVPGGAVAARALDLRPPRELAARLGPGPRHQSRAPGTSSSSRTTWSATTTAAS